jgi:predicted Zn-dependent peptidase
MAQNNKLIRTKMPPIGKHFKLNLTEPKQIKLDNGINTYIINEGQEEFTRLDIVFNAGSSLQSQSLIASSTVSLLVDGTKNMTSSEIAQKVDYHGAYIDTSLTKDKAAITLYTLNKHLPKLLPLISDMVVNANFPESELSNYIHRKKHQFLLNNDKVKHKATAEFNKLVFGEKTAYGKIAELTDYDNVKRENLKEFYSSHYTSQNSYIIISGNISDATVSLVNKYLGSIKNSKSSISVSKINLVNEVKKKNIFIKKEGSLQSAIRIGMPIINKQHSDYNSLVVLNTVFGGYFGSRLMSNLRENKGFTYGVGSYIMNYKHGGFLSVATEVNAKHTTAALSEIELELNKLCNEAIDNSELEIVKNYIYGTYLRSFDGPMSLAERYRSAKDLDLNFDFYIAGLDKMMAKTPQQLQETANKYFNYNDMIKLVVGEMSNAN